MKTPLASYSEIEARLRAAYRYLNLIKNTAKRRYGFTYLAWLGNGAAGYEPDRGRLSVMGAQAVRLQLDELLNNRPLDLGTLGRPAR